MEGRFWFAAILEYAVKIHILKKKNKKLTCQATSRAGPSPTAHRKTRWGVDVAAEHRRTFGVSQEAQTGL